MTSIEPTDFKTDTVYGFPQPTTAGHVVVVGEQGHKCCGGCCDMRRAVIIVNTIHACLITIGIVGILTTLSLFNNVGDAFDDDIAAATTEQYKVPLPEVGLAIMGIQLIAALCGIVGAVKFNVIFTAAAGVAYAVAFVWGLANLIIAAIIYYEFFLYPHVFFIQQMRTGIMTKSNYPSERHSCCCV